jgi:hypothetical protein
MDLARPIDQGPIMAVEHHEDEVHSDWTTTSGCVLDLATAARWVESVK